MGTVAAVDLGATSGRVMLGTIEGTRVRMELVTRFENRPVSTPDGLYWDIHGLFAEVNAGLAAARRMVPDISSVAVDSWAIDYGLLREGRLIGNPHHYRDERVNAVIETVHAVVGPAELFRRNGLQHLPFTTLYQLCADRRWLDLADTMLLIPDLIGYWLTGVAVAEHTNASTTGLLRADTATWDLELCERLDIPSSLLPQLIDPGLAIGPTLPHLSEILGGTMHVVTAASHDTASAVVAVPMDPATAAYVSCGTWGLVGVETERPVLTENARLANFTNEAGLDGSNRLLHNVMGLWLFNESIRTWNLDNEAGATARLLEEAAAVERPVAVFDPNDPRFLAPGDIPSRIAELCREQGFAVPGSRAEVVRSILESLAAAFADAVRTAASLTGTAVSTVHVVGGGALNQLLCQLVADHSGLSVIAGPVEATALGNVLVQARASGMLSGDVDGLRAVVANSVSLTTYRPSVRRAR